MDFPLSSGRKGGETYSVGSGRTSYSRSVVHGLFKETRQWIKSRTVKQYIMLLPKTFNKDKELCKKIADSTVTGNQT
jgi:hypothetical protein